MIQWENENDKQRGEMVSESTATAAEDEENTFKTSGYYNSENKSENDELENLNEAEASLDKTLLEDTSTTQANITCVSELSVNSSNTATVVSLPSPKHKLSVFNAKSDTEASCLEDSAGLHATRNRYSVGSNASDMFVRSLRKKHDSTDTLDSASSYEIRFERPKDEELAKQLIKEKLDEKNILWNIKTAANRQSGEQDSAKVGVEIKASEETEKKVGLQASKESTGLLIANNFSSLIREEIAEYSTPDIRETASLVISENVLPEPELVVEEPIVLESPRENIVVIESSNDSTIVINFCFYL